MRCRIVLALLVAGLPMAWAQDSTAVEEDYSQYADVELAGDSRRYCTPKVLDLSPNKLVSVGYDFQSAYPMIFSGSSASLRNRYNHGLRVAVNAPVISRTRWLVSLGATYIENRYAINFSTSHPLASVLDNDGLRSVGLNVTIFKPLNELNFVLVNSLLDVNGNYGWKKMPGVRQAKISALAVYGWKKHDRLMYGLGIAQTYRVGEMNYIPVILYNYTFPSRNWGIEAFFPARANLRRTFNPRLLGFFGYELEGNSYLVKSRSTDLAPSVRQIELRRSELRIRFTLEKSLKDFVWLSFQCGLRYDWNFNADANDVFRGFNNKTYLLENRLGNALYANISINLVSP